MKEHSFEFQFQGESRDALAMELSNLLSECFPGWSKNTTNKITTSVDSQRSDPVAIAALILSIPTVTLSTWDLAKRMEIKEGVDRLLKWAKEKLEKVPRTHATIRLPNGIVFSLDQVRPEDLLNILSELANNQKQ